MQALWNTQVRDDWNKLWLENKFTILAVALVLTFVRMMRAGPFGSTADTAVQFFATLIVSIVLAFFLHWIFQLILHKFDARSQ